MRKAGNALKVIGLLLIVLPAAVCAAVWASLYGGHPDGAAAMFVAAVLAACAAVAGVVLLFIGFALTG